MKKFVASGELAITVITTDPFASGIADAIASFRRLPPSTTANNHTNSTDRYEYAISLVVH